MCGSLKSRVPRLVQPSHLLLQKLIFVRRVKPARDSEVGRPPANVLTPETDLTPVKSIIILR